MHVVLMHHDVLSSRSSHPEGQIRHEANEGHRRPRKAGNARRGKGDRSGNAAFAGGSWCARVIYGAPGRGPWAVDLQIAQFDPVITVHGTGDHERNCALDQGRVRVAARYRRTG
jgi:hypothetical protein